MINKVAYVNDSLSTLPETTIAAMDAYPESKIIIILGGSEKGLDMTPLALAVASADVRRALLIGQTAPRIATELRAAGYTDFDEMTDLEVAVERAAMLAEPGDVVLLSPACASFDMFADYADRGDRFTAAARRLHPQGG